jgi:hypothetical protein
MLTAKQIEFNKNKFKEVNLTYGVLTPELEEFLGEEIYNSPANKKLSTYGCYPGGLIEYIFLACKYSVKINDFLPEKIRVDKGLIMRTIIISQIGVVGMYILNDDKWRMEKLGEMYKFRKDDVALKVSEKSLYLASEYGIKLTEEQYQTILNSQKDEDDLMSKHHSTTLSNIVKIGFELAVIEMKS